MCFLALLDNLRLYVSRCFTILERSGVPNLGDASHWWDARGLMSVISWVHLYQWGDAIDVRGDVDTKRLGTPDLVNGITDTAIVLLINVITDNGIIGLIVNT